MRRISRSLVRAVVIAGALLALAPAEAEALPDASGEVSVPNFDILDVEAGILPEGHPMIPTDTRGIAVWVRIQFGAPFPPPDDVQGWVFSDSKFYPDPDKPGQTIHVSGSFNRNTTQGTITRSSCAADTSSCPPAFPVKTHPQPDGSLIIVNGLPSRPQEISFRAAATFLRPGTTNQTELDQFPDNQVPVPINMTPVDPVVASGETTDDGGSSAVIIIVVVAVVALVGLGLVVFIVRRRPTVPPYCDWQLVYDDGTAKGRVLRPARGKRCCVYTIEVGSAYHMPEWAEYRRQLSGPDHRGPDSDRLRLVGPRGPTDVGLGFADLELDVRSGPAGTLDWTQGTGEARPTGSEGSSTVERLLADGSPTAPSLGARPQSWQFEEPPDVAGHLVWSDDTKIEITAVRECPSRSYFYACDGKGEAGVDVTHECTNESARASNCPVELSTVAEVTGEIRGGINYLARAPTAGAPPGHDRPRPPTSPAPAPPPPP
ncbi:MAG: hypothetical protein ACT4OX_14830, partial [Actinomycetota bacterium]